MIQVRVKNLLSDLVWMPVALLHDSLQHLFMRITMRCALLDLPPPDVPSKTLNCEGGFIYLFCVHMHVCHLSTIYYCSVKKIMNRTENIAFNENN